LRIHVDAGYVSGFLGLPEAESLHRNSRSIAIYVWGFLADGVGTGVGCDSDDH